MEDNIVHKFIDKFKSRFSKNKQMIANTYEYAFSDEEIESINRENKQKIQELKQDIFTKKKDSYNSSKTNEVLSKLSNHMELQDTDNQNLPQDDAEEISEDIIIEPINEAVVKEQGVISAKEEFKPKNSFIKLSSEQQKKVMDKWNELNLNKIDKDIMSAKDLLNHNYTIAYADEALRFIQYIRKEYEIVICYLIGFNNEKQGIYDKTYFGDNLDDEWKYLSNYIKILEKIRRNK